MAKNKDNIDHTEENKLETLRSLDQGSGVELTMGVGDRVEYYYSSKLDAPEGLPKDLKVEVSSVSNDNKELLHHLLQKTRSESQIDSTQNH